MNGYDAYLPDDHLPFDDEPASDTGHLMTFRASIPPIATAVKLDGAGDGMRLQLDVPGSDVEAAIDLWRVMAGRSFRVVIVRDETVEDGS